MGYCASGTDSDCICMFVGWLFEIAMLSISMLEVALLQEGRLLRILNRSLNDEATDPFDVRIYIRRIIFYNVREKVRMEAASEES